MKLNDMPILYNNWMESYKLAIFRANKKPHESEAYNSICLFSYVSVV